MRVIALMATAGVAAPWPRSAKDVGCLYVESTRDNILQSVGNLLS